MLRVAVAQICSTGSTAANFAFVMRSMDLFLPFESHRRRKIAGFAREAAREKCDLLCVPECFDWIKKGNPGERIELAERLFECLLFIPLESQRWMARCSRSTVLWLPSIRLPSRMAGFTNRQMSKGPRYAILTSLLTKEATL
jgi:hypothetical protein